MLLHPTNCLFTTNHIRRYIVCNSYTIIISRVYWICTMRAVLCSPQESTYTADRYPHTGSLYYEHIIIAIRSCYPTHLQLSIVVNTLWSLLCMHCAHFVWCACTWQTTFTTSNNPVPMWSGSFDLHNVAKCVTVVFYKREAPLDGGWALGWPQPTYPRVCGICTLEYPESFNGYSLVSEHIMVQVHLHVDTNTVLSFWC